MFGYISQKRSLGLPQNIKSKGQPDSIFERIPTMAGHLSLDGFRIQETRSVNFSNRIVKDYYKQTWHAHADPEHFRKQFIKECNREWDIKIQCDYVENSIQYITGTNSNAIGSLISTEKVKP